MSFYTVSFLAPARCSGNKEWVWSAWCSLPMTSLPEPDQHGMDGAIPSQRKTVSWMLVFLSQRNPFAQELPSLPTFSWAIEWRDYLLWRQSLRPGFRVIITFPGPALSTSWLLPWDHPPSLLLVPFSFLWVCISFFPSSLSPGLLHWVKFHFWRNSRTFCPSV